MVSPLSSLGGAGPVTQAQSRASISRDQFLQILVSELSQQNPLDPLDNAQFMQQLVGLQSLEQTAALTDSLKTFERFLQMASGSAMIGRKVTGITPAGELVAGFVTKVALENGQVNVVVGNSRLPIESVVEIATR
jgi:flagellar basal-body rod modification protein FlgD